MKKDTQEAAFRQRVLEYQQKGHSVTDTANRYHLSRKTVHKWRNRWDGTRESLEDRSRRPKNSPRKQTEAEIRLVKRQAKKNKWRDIILAYQGARERGYSRSFGCFSKTVRKLQEEKPGKERKKRKNDHGVMATGWKEIKGQWEMFDDSGLWLYTWQEN